MQSFVWNSVLLSPLIELGAAVRFDQLICPVVFFFAALRPHKVTSASRGSQVFFMYSMVLIVLGFCGTFVDEEFAAWRIFKWPLVFLTNIIAAWTIMWSFQRNKETDVYYHSIKHLQTLLFFIGAIGLLQVAEQRGLMPVKIVTPVLAKAYPYQGELSDAGLDKAGGFNLKLGGACQLTSVVDGHPILAGDLLAFGLLLTLPLVQGFRGLSLHAFPLIGLLLTLSRGSIVPWLCGLGLYGFLITQYRPVGRTLKRMAQRLILLSGLFSLVVFSPFGDSIRWRISSTFDTFSGIGARDGRTEKVWPVVFSRLQECSFAEFLFGFRGGYQGPTDSQYLFTLVNDGALGVLALLVVHALVFFLCLKRAAACSLKKMECELFLALASATGCLMLIYIFHPAYQNRRLLSILVISTVLIFHQKRFQSDTENASIEGCENDGLQRSSCVNGAS